MRYTLRNNKGEVLGVWVSKTVRGFNARQRKEIEAAKDKDLKQQLETTRKRLLTANEKRDTMMSEELGERVNTKRYEDEGFGGDYGIPGWIDDAVDNGVLLDCSWHNDLSARFEVEKSANERGEILSFWLTAADPMRRGDGEPNCTTKRYLFERVDADRCILETGVDGYELETDDEDEAKAYIDKARGMA